MKLQVLNILLTAFAGLSLFAQEPVKIGLLIQEKDHKAALQAAELAVNNTNLRGGIKGRKVVLVSKSMEGAWGTGSKQAVDLIWNDRVCALVASCDGRNAHLVEQACAKSITPLISAWSTDPTLSHAFIPWFYNNLPNDEQQGSAIAKEVYEVRHLKKPVIITDNSYDSQKALIGYKRYDQASNREASSVINFDLSKSAPDELIHHINNAKPDCIILMASPSTALTVIRVLKIKTSGQPIFGSLQVLNENVLSESEYLELKNQIIFTCIGDVNTIYESFEKLYKQKYNSYPGMVAAFAYDAVNVLIEAIKVSGTTESEDISKALSSIRYDGVTGFIRFAEWGVRQGSCFF